MTTDRLIPVTDRAEALSVNDALNTAHGYPKNGTTDAGYPIQHPTLKSWGLVVLEGDMRRLGAVRQTAAKTWPTARLEGWFASE